MTSYRRFFNTKEAERRLRRYRASGLDLLARGIVDYLADRKIEGASLLEVGGGVGDLQIEMLRAGVAGAVNIELSAGYEVTAHRLLGEEGLEDRVTRRLGDFVEEQGSLDPADIVILNRVVCCYPWPERMLPAAVSKTQRFLGLVFPKDTWWMKTSIGLGNTWMAIRNCAFRGFVHPVADMEALVVDAGLVARHRQGNFGWQAVVFERVT